MNPGIGTKSPRRKSVALKFQDPQELLMSEPMVVKNRAGSVLCRGMILKSDHYESGICTKFDIKLKGAPNFRMSDINVCGVSQPTLIGIKTVLTLLRAHPGSLLSSKVLWISTREEPLVYIDQEPFVIRDLNKPFKNISTYQGIRTNRLEQMEERLKKDILLERDRWSGLVLIHKESSERKITPTWVAVTNVQTPREIFAELKEEGFLVGYDRIPISPEQAPKDVHMEMFIQAVMEHPTIQPLVFNCGMGRGRTTCAIVIALIIRRFKILKEQGADHFHIKPNADEMSDNIQHVGMVELFQVLDQAFAESGTHKNSIEWAMTRSPVLVNLLESMKGNYRIVSQLCSLLPKGREVKYILDEAIDRSSIFVNLRKTILVHRLSYSSLGDASELAKATSCMERYLALLSLCAYLQENFNNNTDISFSEWLASRPDIFNLLSRVSDSTPSLLMFKPSDNISVFSSNYMEKGLSAWGPHTNQPASELDQYVIKGRKGAVLAQDTILKEDFWAKVTTHGPINVKGASNFRQIPGFPVYGVAQPTLQGVKNVLEHIGPVERVIWINLREEPFIYINSIPYVLRDLQINLRNMKSFRGITPTGLEIIEAKLKNDVLGEISKYSGKVLLHQEGGDGHVSPIWEECSSHTVLSLKDAMHIIKTEMEFTESRESQTMFLEHDKITKLNYFRVPLTAEQCPDPEDFDHMILILKRVKLDNLAVILNCQIGHGRSTTGTVITVLILRWLGMTDVIPMLAKKDLTSLVGNNCNYQIVHALLRVVRNGIECKQLVDKVIDSAGHILNIRESIEYFRQKKETESDPTLKERYNRRGIVSLQRYFSLILFQNYLNQNPPGLDSDLISFKEWINMHPEFETIKEECLYSSGADPLVPVTEMEPGDGIALTDEVIDTVNRRRGAVLSQGTIVKYDIFPGCQKLTLKERIEGAPNFRLVPIIDLFGHDSISGSQYIQCGLVAGVGMPSIQGIRSVLEHMNAGPNGTQFVCWTSLREEPVVYIKGNPYVLRLFIEPIKNLVTTGINSARVEAMEEQMKKDLLMDLRLNNGRLLLHEERTENSNFLVTPVWETLSEDQISTPLEVYNFAVNDGYRVDYVRIPITDELAPIPDVFDQLVDRILRISDKGVPIFNCQMGRGRTTQGLVITSLMKSIVGNPNIEELHDAIVPEHEFDVFSMRSEDSSVVRIMESPIEKLCKAGNYSIILQLLAVLQYGMPAKYLVDLVIDNCSHMQNLRTAIYDYKNRLNSLKAGTKKYEITNEIGCNYLVRYFYLIAFADYLIEVWSVTVTNPLKFTVWLQMRPEIHNIVKAPHMGI